MAEDHLVDESEHWEMENFGVLPDGEEDASPGDLFAQIDAVLSEKEKRLLEKAVYHLDVKKQDPLYKLIEVLTLYRAALGEVPGELERVLGSLQAVGPKISEEIGKKIEVAASQIQALGPDIAESIALKVNVSLQEESRQTLERLAEFRAAQASTRFDETLEEFGRDMQKELRAIRAERTKLERERAKRRYGILPATLICLTILGATATGGVGVALYFGIL